MENMISDLQSELLKMMKIVHEICVNNNIRYYIIGGTQLGAVRHQGFIPWDDDIDIGLPRSDYDKLLNLPSDEWPEHLYIKTPNNSTDLIFPYAKIINKNTTLIEDRLNGIIEGIYIDVFPLDGAGHCRYLTKIRYYRYYWKQGLLFNNQDHGRKKTFLRRIIQSYARICNRHKLYMNVYKFMSKKDFDKSRYIGNYAGAWGLKEFMLREHFGHPKLYKFEDSYFFGVEDANSYLKSLYGEYMLLPPDDKRKSHHNFKYIDLSSPYERYRTNL